MKKSICVLIASAFILNSNFIVNASEQIQNIPIEVIESVNTLENNNFKVDDELYELS